MYNNDIQEQEELNEGSLTTDTAVRSMNYPKASAIKRKDKRSEQSLFLSQLFGDISEIVKRFSLLFNEFRNSIKKVQSSKSGRNNDSIRRSR